MIISRTPLRISFVGSYTDHQDWYLKNGGLVIGATINKYVYVMARKNEFASKSDDYLVNLVITNLKNKKIDCENLDVKYISDIPSHFDFGYISALIIGILKSIYSLNKIYKTNFELSNDCNEILTNNNIFNLKADAFLCVNGGFNAIKLNKDGSVLKIGLSDYNDMIESFKSNLSLYYLNNSNEKTLYDFDYLDLKKEKELWIIKKLSEDSLDLFMSNRYKDLVINIGKAFVIKENAFYRANKNYVSDFSSKCIFSKLPAFDISSHNGYGCGITYSLNGNNKISLLNDFKKIDFDFEYDGSQVIL